MVNRRDKSEKLPRDYRRGRIIKRIDYHKMPATTESDLHIYLNRQKADMHPPATPFVSPLIISFRCPQCPHCRKQAVNVDV